MAGPKASVRVLAHREDIHTQKSLRMIGFEPVPLIQVGLIGHARKLSMKFFDHRQIVKGFEGQERQIIIVQKCSDLGDREAMFHDVEEQIAAAAHAIEIVPADQHAPVFRLADEVLATPSDVFGCGAITARRDVGTGLHDNAARQIAV